MRGRTNVNFNPAPPPHPVPEQIPRHFRGFVLKKIVIKFSGKEAFTLVKCLAVIAYFNGQVPGPL